MITIRRFFLLTALAAILAACQAPSAPDDSAASSTTGALIVTAGSSSSRTILPADISIASYRLVATAPSGENLPTQTSSSGTFTLTDLAPGNWNIEVDGIDSDSRVSLLGVATVAVVAGKTASASIALSPQSAAKGNLAITLTWPATKSVAYVYAVLLTTANPADTVRAFSGTIAGSSATIEGTDLATGTYILTITLGNTYRRVARTLTETILLYNGKTATATIDLQDSDFGTGSHILYSGNGGQDGGIDESFYLPGAVATVINPHAPQNSDVYLDGYFCTSWNTSADGTGTPYAFGSSLVVGSGDVTLYAVWKSTGGLTVSGSTVVGIGSASGDPLVIPEGITEIGDSAFCGYTGSAAITIPNTVTRIGTSAFDSCTGLTGIALPPKVTAIEAGTFANCTSLASIAIPANITAIGANAFTGCTNLASATIASSVASIGDTAFASCTSLTTLAIPAGVTSIGTGVFRGCTALTGLTVSSANPAYKAVDGCLYSRDGSILYVVPTTKAGDFEVPAGVTTIGPGAFEGCSGITSVSLPASLKAIQADAFLWCSALTEITIPAGVTELGVGAFCNCTKLVTATLKSATPPAAPEPFPGCTQLKEILVPSNAAVLAYQQAAGWKSYASKIICRIPVQVVVP